MAWQFDMLAIALFRQKEETKATEKKAEDNLTCWQSRYSAHTRKLPSPPSRQFTMHFIGVHARVGAVCVGVATFSPVHNALYAGYAHSLASG